MKSYLSGVLMMALLAIFDETASAQFKIDAQIRPRAEVRNGYTKLAAEGSNPTFLVSQRTRINFSYETENLKFRIIPQDVRLWGDDTEMSLSGSNGNANSFTLYEGVAEIKLKEYGWVSIGRQELNYDNQTILAAPNWGQTGATADAILLKLKLSDWNLHIAGSFNSNDPKAQSNNYYPTDRYKSLNFIWLNRRFNDNLKASLIHVASGRTESVATNRIYFRQTTGVYGSYKTDALNLWGNAYYQYGKSQTSNKVSAFLTDIEASYKINAITPGIGFSYISGNSDTLTASSTESLYEPIYRSRHTFNGGMDYYVTYSKQTANGGLVNLYAFVDFAPLKVFSIRNTFHLFQLAQTNPDTPTDKALGYENDLVGKYKFADWGALEAGYMFYIPTETLKTIQGVANDKFSQFAYVQLTLTPTLYKQEPKPVPAQ